MAITIKNNLVNNYDILLNDLILLENQMKIYQARKLSTCTQLSIIDIEDENEILLIHGIHDSNNYRIEKKLQSYYKIYHQDKIIYSFIICKHQYYTPISTGIKIESISEQSICLLC